MALPAQERQHHLAVGRELLVTQLEEQREVLLELLPVQLHHRRRRGLPDVDVALVQNRASRELLRYLETHDDTHMQLYRSELLIRPVAK